jgi:hypothetical protein
VRNMNVTSTTRIPRLGQGGWRRRDVPMVLAAVGLAALAAGCSQGSTQPGPAPSSAAGGQHSSAGGTNGQITTNGQGGQSNTGQSGQGNTSAGVFSLAFARCMRANGVPNFPDPNGQSGQLGPSSGIDPTSPAFQAALNGPCKSLAPAGWVGSGKVTR